METINLNEERNLVSQTNIKNEASNILRSASSIFSRIFLVEKILLLLKFSDGSRRREPIPRENVRKKSLFTAAEQQNDENINTFK